MLSPCRTGYLPAESFHHTSNANNGGDNWRFLPYLCCPNIFHEYLQCHDPRIFNNDQTDILHFLSEMAASHYHPFITSPPHGITQGMVAVQWSEKGKIPKGIVNRNFGFLIRMNGMFPEYTEVGYHHVRNKIWRNSCLSRTEIVTCSLHGTEYRVELYRKVDENVRSEDAEVAREAAAGKTTQMTQETSREEAGETELMTEKPGKENGGRERSGAGKTMVIDAA